MGLLGVSAWQKVSGGLQVELIALGWTLGPLGVLLLWASPRARVHSVAAPVLGLAALGAVRPASVGEWGACLATLAAVIGVARVRVERALPGGRVAEVGALCAVLAMTAVALVQGHYHGVLKALALIPFAWEALARWRPRTPEASVRRIASAWVVVGANLAEGIRGSAWEGSFPVSAGLVAALGVSAVALHRGLAEVERGQRRRVQRTLLKVLSPVVVLASLALLGELALHVVPNGYRGRVLPPRNFTFHVPHGETEYLGAYYSPPEYDEPIPIRWNAHGWFDDDHELPKPEGTRRLLVVGDSYVEGVQVRLADHYHERLESALAERSRTPVEAIAYGWSGWGQLDELEALTRGVPNGAERNLPDYPPGLDYAPELVVLELLPANDVLNNHPELEQRSADESASALQRQMRRSLDRGLLFSALLADKADRFLKRVAGAKDPIDGGVFQRAPQRFADEWAHAWAETERLLGEIKAAVEARGARLVVVLFTSAMELHQLREGQQGDFDFRYPTLRLAEICEQLAIPCLDLAPLLTEHPPKGEAGVHLRHDGHWSALGHRLAAEATAEWLVERGLWALPD